MLGHEQIGRLTSARDVVAQVGTMFAPDQPFYSVRFYDQTLPFYLKRTVTLVDYADEMQFGITREPHKVVPTLDEFMTRWTADRAPSARARGQAVSVRDRIRSLPPAHPKPEPRVSGGLLRL